MSGFISEGISLCVVVYLLCLREEGSSGASYVTILVLQTFLLILVDLNMYALGSILVIICLIFSFPFFDSGVSFWFKHIISKDRKSEFS